LTAGDEDALGRDRGEALGGRSGIEAAVERDLARREPEPVEFGDGRG
jgi:hypothetical protein